MIIVIHILQQPLHVILLRIMFLDILMNVVQMMIRAQTQVVVIVAAIMIKKKLVPLEGQGVQDKPSLR